MCYRHARRTCDRRPRRLQTAAGLLAAGEDTRGFLNGRSARLAPQCFFAAVPFAVATTVAIAAAAAAATAVATAVATSISTSTTLTAITAILATSASLAAATAESPQTSDATIPAASTVRILTSAFVQPAAKPQTADASQTAVAAFTTAARAAAIAAAGPSEGPSLASCLRQGGVVSILHTGRCDDCSVARNSHRRLLDFCAHRCRHADGRRVDSHELGWRQAVDDTPHSRQGATDGTGSD